MDKRIVFARTRKGEHELATRRYHLRQRFRTILILVDGKSSVANLRRKCAGLGNIDPSLKSLADQGYIRPTVGGLSMAVPLTPIKAALIKQAVLTLGMTVTAGIRALQQAPDTKTGLIRAVGETARLAHNATNEEAVTAFREACHEILIREAPGVPLPEAEHHEPAVANVDDPALYNRE